MKQSGVFEMLAAMAICGTIGITVLMSGQSEVSLIFYRCFFGALVLLFDQFREFCTRHEVRHLTTEEGARLDFERMKWRFGAPGIEH